MPLRERLARIPGITITNIGVTDLGGGKSLQFSVQGADLAELERLSKSIMPSGCARSPAWSISTPP